MGIFPTLTDSQQFPLETKLRQLKEYILNHNFNENDKRRNSEKESCPQEDGQRDRKGDGANDFQQQSRHLDITKQDFVLLKVLFTFSHLPTLLAKVFFMVLAFSPHSERQGTRKLLYQARKAFDYLDRIEVKGTLNIPLLASVLASNRISSKMR